MDTPRNLDVLLSKVVDEDTFLDFLEGLRDNKREEEEIERVHPSSPQCSGALGWENGSIYTFLDAAVAWGRGGNPDDTNPWHRAAYIIYAGKFYE
jgi:hypothetical protein